MPDFIDHSDFMSRSSLLRKHGKTRTAFDPANEAHLASFKKFLETGSWGDVMFFPEFPFTDVPTYVMHTYASSQLGAHRITNVERAANQKSLREQSEINMVKGELLEDAEF